MGTSRKHLVRINSLNDLLRAFLVDVPPDYRFETTRIQIYPISYFLPFLRVPTPLNTAPFSYLILNSRGTGIVQVNADRVSIQARMAMFVHRGSVVSLRSIHPSTAGWMIMYDDSVMGRVLQPRTLEQVAGLRSPIPFSSATLDWMEHLCALLEQQMQMEPTGYQPVCEHLFGALVERLLAGNTPAQPRRIDRPEALDRQFRQLVLEHALTEGSVGFYADRLNVSENYLLRCVSRSSGRSPKDWILDVRLMQARKLLRTTDGSVAEIAMQTGFDDPSYFGRLFRRRFGMSPRAFRTIPEQDLSG